MEKIKREIGNNNIWISIDSTIDVCGRIIGNVIVGSLRETRILVIFQSIF